MRVRARVCAVAFAVFALGLAAAPALAAWPHDPYNGNVLVCGAPNGQAAVSMATDGSGGAILTWLDFRNGVNNDIFAQRVTAGGVPAWTTDGVRVCPAAGDQLNPAAVSDGAGGAIIAWSDFRSASTYDIYAQRFNASGVPQWASTGVAISTAAGNQQSPVIASDGAGGAIIAWADNRGGATADLYAQRVSSLGTLQWLANGVAVCTAANDQIGARIVADGAGGAILAWYDFRVGAASDIYAQRLNAAGAAQWTANGASICTFANIQSSPALCADGSGGAVIAWQDLRSGATYDIYAQRVNAGGLLVWSAGGQAVCAAAGDQTNVSLATDGAGGAIVAWQDFRSGSNYDVYAQRVTGGGAPLWTADGIAVSAAIGDQSAPITVGDGAGGAIVGWLDFRYGNNDLFAQRLAPTGVNQWTSGGIPVSAASSSLASPTVSSDGNGGAIFGWEDLRSVTAYDIYAQRVEFYGQLGSPEPASAGVHDVPNDQGGAVKVGWTPSYLDDAPTYGILDYRVWRSAPPNGATTRAALVRGITADADDAAANGRYLAVPASAAAYLWEFVGSEPAAQLAGYSMIASTTGDSVGAGNPQTAFMIEARTNTSVSQPHWFSAPDSGYSVDNLPPVTPAPFTGNYAAGAVHLHWNPNTESDLAGYRLYGGTTAGFPPDAGHLVAALPDTGFTGAEAAGEFYKLTAIDAHGNESRVALLAPSGIAAVGGAEPSRAYFALSSANPVRAAGGMVLRFGVTRAGRVVLAIYDAGGRRVRVLADGGRDPGEFTLRWDGRDEAGAGVAPGLYFARLEAPGFSATRRIVRAG